MSAELSNLWLFALIIGKCALYTGLGPGIFFVYVAEMLVRADRVPTRDQFETWTKFLRVGARGSVSLTYRVRPVSNGAEARPADLKGVA
jgi:hypothetical protein